jgi:hypothetical protein
MQPISLWMLMTRLCRSPRDAARRWSHNRLLACYQACIDVEVNTERGDWRTLIQPTDLQQLDLISKG